MRYISTRDSAGASCSLEEAALGGYAPDGGMLLPETIPAVSHELLCQWRRLSYPQLCEAVLGLFVGSELPELHDICQRAFSKFGSPEVVEVVPLPGTSAATAEAGTPLQLHVAELWHGPSLAFKDLGMQVLCQALQALVTRPGSGVAGRRTVVVSTSGDTGPSALQAVTDTPNLDCVVLYPLGRVSPVQEAQMLARRHDKNCVVVACEGTSDDMDVPCGGVFGDTRFRTQHALGTVNSVNILRLLAQVAHFFYAYCRAVPACACRRCVAADSGGDGGSGGGGGSGGAGGGSSSGGGGSSGSGTGSNSSGSSGSAAAAESGPPRVVFAVPTGAAGNVAAGVIAQQMGLPVAGWVVAVNRNDVLHRMLSTGVLQKGREVAQTSAPAMDIQAPYNVERLFHLLWPPGDPPAARAAAIRAAMAAFYAGGAVPLPPALTARFRQLGFISRSVSGTDAAAAMRSVRTRDGYVVDPHTAVGVAAVLDTAAELVAAPGAQQPRGAAVVVCMGCAHPAKFPETLRSALQLPSEEAALAAVPNRDHACVAATLAATRELVGGEGGAAAAAAEVEVFRRGEDWLEKLRAVIEGVTARREAPAAAGV